MNVNNKVASSLLAGVLVLAASCSKPQLPPNTTAPLLLNTSERDISYLIEREDQGHAIPVSEDFRFKSGDRFRLRMRSGFPAFVYVVNRGQSESAYKLLFPLDKERDRNPLAAGGSVELPDASQWMRFDQSKGNEYLVLIASTMALPDFEKIGGQIARDSFEAKLAAIERSYRPDSSRRFSDSGWTKLYAARTGPMAIVVRLALQHM